MRTTINIYRQLGKYLEAVDAEAQAQGKGPEDLSVDADFRSGVYLGVGLSNLVLSMMPAKLLTIVELFGYKGDRHAGLAYLQRAGGWTTNSDAPSVDLGASLPFLASSRPRRILPSPIPVAPLVRHCADAPCLPWEQRARACDARSATCRCSSSISSSPTLRLKGSISAWHRGSSITTSSATRTVRTPLLRQSCPWGSYVAILSCALASGHAPVGVLAWSARPSVLAFFFDAVIVDFVAHCI